MFKWKKAMLNFLFFATLVYVALTASVEYDTENDANVVHEQSEASHDYNETHHSNETHHGAHHGIHVASINFDYVKQPLIVTLFMLAVVICKIGKYHQCFHRFRFFIHTCRKEAD
jgi:hypothetical protein